MAPILNSVSYFFRCSGDMAHLHSFVNIRTFRCVHNIGYSSMGLFLDEDTAVYLSDVGINVEGLGEDFTGIETVSATPFMEEVAFDAGKLKSELGTMRNELRKVQQAVVDEIGIERDSISFTDESFDLLLAEHRISNALVQKLLELKSRISSLESQLGQASSVVFSETVTRIHLPCRIDLSKFVL